MFSALTDLLRILPSPLREFRNASNFSDGILAVMLRVRVFLEEEDS